MANHSNYKPEYCDELIAHQSAGFSFESFAGKLGVSRSSIYRWVDAHPEFAEAKAIAEMKCLYHWEEIGNQGMRSGKDFNATVWIYSMKARFAKHGWHVKDAEPQQAPVPQAPPKKLSKEEMSALVKAAKERK